jgi:hypothetical protein
MEITQMEAKLAKLLIMSQKTIRAKQSLPPQPHKWGTILPVYIPPSQTNIPPALIRHFMSLKENIALQQILRGH